MSAVLDFVKDAVDPLAVGSGLLESVPDLPVVNLLGHLPQSSLIGQLAKSVANTFFLPANSVLMLGLGVFSSMATRVYQVDYPFSGSVPIGLYVVAEQPPATAKSVCLDVFKKPFYTAYTAACNRGYAGSLFTTDATPEGLDLTLENSGGFFSCVSSEKTLFDSLLGAAYGEGKRANNCELLLNGFDGGFIAGQRVGRKAYMGKVAGSVVLFAQEGSIAKLLPFDNGLPDRFIKLCEPHLLGKRDHFNVPPMQKDLLAKYDDRAGHFANSAFDGGELLSLKISEDGWHAIKAFKMEIEPHLADGGRFAMPVSLRGYAGKNEQLVMKLAGNLHLVDGGMGELIPVDTVVCAINIVRDLLELALGFYQQADLVGVPAEFNAVIRLFGKDNKPRTERQLLMSLSNVAIFKSVAGNRSAHIRNVLKTMVKAGFLSCSPISGGSGLCFCLAK